MKHYLIGLCGALIMVFCGCSNITMLRTEELRAVQARIDTLSVHIEQKQNQIGKMQKEQHELLRMVRADLQVQFGQVDTRLSALESAVSESQDRISHIDQKTQEIRQRWEERARADSLLEQNQNAEIEKLFQIAYGDFTAGRFELALGGFQDLVKRFPEAPLAMESHYWIAECFYAQKENEKAQQGYIEHIKNYPQSPKRCACLYKLGLVYDRMNKSKSKKMVWDNLLQNCADTEEAQAAQAQMQ
jgi:tol-pal system protein YbgF